MENKLVSVLVVAYNSSATIVETLDSIYGQTYSELELIVSDDCSKDNTVEIVRDWLATHSQRFRRAELLTTEKNTGIAANFNRAERVATGEWVKVIAGDDILLPECVETMVGYVSEHTDAVYVFSRMRGFGQDVELVDYVMNNIFDYSFFSLSIPDQQKRLVFQGNCLPAPTAFYNLRIMREKGITYDERIPLLEDFPRWLNLLSHGIRFHFIDKELVLYRFSETSLSNVASNKKKLSRDMNLTFLYYFFPIYKKYVGRLKAYNKYIVNAHLAFGGYWTVLYRIDQFFIRLLRQLHLVEKK